MMPTTSVTRSTARHWNRSGVSGLRLFGLRSRFLTCSVNEGKLHGMLIDLIDDEEHVRATLAEIVEILGHESRQFESGDAYLAFVKSSEYQQPKIVISDVRMPGMDGYSTMRAVHALHPEIAFIIITGYQEITNRYSEIPHTFMRKPFNPEVLESLLDDLDTDN